MIVGPDFSCAMVGMLAGDVRAALRSLKQGRALRPRRSPHC
jgi:hypothetical protein